MIYLFTTRSCPKCETVKRFIENHEEIKEKIGDINIMNTMAPDGREKAIKYGLRAAPTLVIANEADDMIEQYSGDGDIINFFETKLG